MRGYLPTLTMKQFPKHQSSRRPGRSFNRPKRHFSNNRRGRGGSAIHFSKFINKAVITEEVEVFVPEHQFESFSIDARLKSNIAQKGFKTPTPIQDKAIPHVLRGEDVVGIANTGTGKTSAFLIPLLHKVISNRSERVLIMVPTRELAIQIDTECRALAGALNIHSVCVVGGANIVPQIRTLRRGPHFVIGTPGRLKDVIERRELDLSRFATVVLDEADRMLDMGFINDMRTILGRMNSERQTLFFSATLSHDIERLIGDFLKSPTRISVKTRDTAQSIDQDVVRIENGKQKIQYLQELLALPEFNKVLVFGRTKHGVERLSKTLCELGFKAESIHGNKNHNQRQRALKLFKENAVTVLVATDVAARGLDIPKVSHVINYDVPENYEDYVHRIGRTGRAGSVGKALTFIE